MRLLEDFVAWVATICTIGLFLTGIPICVKIVKKGTTADTAVAPLLMNFVTSSMWLKYAILKPDHTLLIVNSVGAITAFIYLNIYTVYTRQRLYLFRKFFMGLCVIFPVLYFVQYYTTNKDEALSYLGTVNGSLGVLAYGAPLVSVMDVIKMQSSECMAFPMCFANFIVSFEWLIYGHLKKDHYIQVPNGIGLVLAVMQLLLFVIYPAPPVEKHRVITTQPVAAPS